MNKPLFLLVIVCLTVCLCGLKARILEPADGKVYHGVQTMTYATTGDPLAGYLSALNDSSIQPAVRGLFVTIPGERGPDNSFKGLKTFLYGADSIGFIPEISLFFMDKAGSTDSVIAVSNQHDWILDSIITLCKTYGKKMFLRIGGEFNGSGSGWNGGGYHPYLYVNMFRKVVDKFAQKGLRDSIAVNWCYEPDAANDFDSVDSKGARWYPGDNYVDWFGLDLFDANHFDQSLPDFSGRNITKKGKSERFLAMARTKGKPVYMSETSAKAVNISNDNQDGIDDWNNWFAKFFAFIDAHKEIKGYGYIDANWPVSAYPGWGDSRIENSPYVVAKYIEEMKKSKYIHLKAAQTPPDTTSDTTLIKFPINDLGTGLYKSFQGGMYPSGLNSRPVAHNDAGLFLSGAIQPLDTAGIPNKNGKIVLLSVGMSNTTQEYSAFKAMADTFSLKNPGLLVIDGAQGGQTAAIIKDPKANYWTVSDQRIRSAGASPNQVQAVWLKEADASPKNDFPLHAQTLTAELKQVVKNLKIRYTNIKLCYLSSRTYGGYATSTLNPEPMAYESGFSVKWLIESQINGDTNLIYSGIRAKSPWLSWGPYLWADGTNPRSDGLIWNKDDFVTSDYTHPSTSGRLKVADLLMKFFTTDTTAKSWFLKQATSYVAESSTNVIKISPNPATDYIYLTMQENSAGSEKIVIYNSMGMEVMRISTSASEGQMKIDVTGLPAGLYFVRCGGSIGKFVKE